MPNVYLLLSRTDTLFARAMHGLTGNRYTHVSLALDRDLEQMYSFARRYEIAPLPAGFIRENLYDGVYGRSGTADSLVLELPDHPSLVRPEDFAYLEPLRVVYQGPLAWAGRVGRRAMAA